MFNWDEDPVFAPLPGVNMPRHDRDFNPFAERDEDGANSNQDWQPTPEPEEVPDPVTTSGSAAVIADMPNEARASSSSLIDIARVIHAPDYPRALPRRRLPRRTGGTTAQQVALMDGLRQVAGYDASLAANRFPFAPAHQVRYDLDFPAFLHQDHPHAGKSLEVPLVVDDKGYMDIASDLLHLLPQDPFDSPDLKFCK